jgi:phosphate transport system protein
LINTRKRQDSELAEIKRMLFRLGKIGGNAVVRAVWALEKGDAVTARAIIDGDDALDELTRRIDENCMSFGARYQPLGQDLRAITSIMHMAVDLERVGDYGVNIARASIEMEGRVLIKPLIDVPRMAGILSEMLDKTLTAFDICDAEMAENVFTMDEQIDELERQIVRELFTMVMERVDRLEQAFLLMGVARTLERAGDHVTNIAERAIYMCTGKTVRASNYKHKQLGHNVSEGQDHEA